MSPAYHRTFSTPRELVTFIGRLRELAGGKPTGFKLCLGSRVDLLAICKAMVEEGVTPDFIVVDGAEGGTGAAPMEFSDHVGMPLTEALMTVDNALVGAGLRDRIKVGASGKVATGVDVVKRIIQGADYTNAARAMMMAVGCIQAQTCHTNTCPVGVATQDPKRTRALDVPSKTLRVDQLPARGRRVGAQGRGLDGAALLRRPRAAHAPTPDRPRHDRVVRRDVRLPGLWRAARHTARELARRLGGRRPRPLHAVSGHP